MNKNHMIAGIVSVASLLAAGTVSAADAAPEAPEWKISAELGFVMTSGNSETSTTNAKFDATHEKDKWRHNVHAEAFGASTTDNSVTPAVKTTSGERYQLSEKSDYKFNDVDFAFGTFNYEKDRFSGFDHQMTVAAGYGRRLISDEDMTLDVEIGPGVRKVETDAGVTESDGIVRLGAKYEWKVSDTSTFTENFTSDVSSDLTTSKSVTALTAKVNTRLAMKLSLTIKNNSEVPVGSGKEKTDTETAVTLVYSF